MPGAGTLRGSLLCTQAHPGLIGRTSAAEDAMAVLKPLQDPGGVKLAAVRDLPPNLRSATGRPEVEGMWAPQNAFADPEQLW